MLTPADIDKKEFGTVRLREGYDQDEVDNFLDLAAQALTAANEETTQARAEAAQYKSRLAIVQRQLDAYGEQPTTQMEAVPAAPPVVPMPEFLGDVSRILSVAQQSADEQMAEAAGKAGQLIREAEIKASAVVGQAVTDAEQAKVRAQGDLYSMQQNLSAVKEQHDKLKSFLTDQLTALQAKMEEGTP